MSTESTKSIDALNDQEKPSLLERIPDGGSAGFQTGALMGFFLALFHLGGWSGLIASAIDVEGLIPALFLTIFIWGIYGAFIGALGGLVGNGFGGLIIGLIIGLLIGLVAENPLETFHIILASSLCGYLGAKGLKPFDHTSKK